MNVQEILNQLCEERRRLDQAIATLEELAAYRKRGPGRPRGSRNRPTTGEEGNPEDADQPAEHMLMRASAAN